MRLGPLLALAPLLLSVTGCAETFRLPMSAADLADYPPGRSGPALVAYLGQPDANPTVCQLNATSPHLPDLTPDVQRSLVGALRAGEVEPELWRKCAGRLLKTSAEADAAKLMDAIGHAYRSILVDGDFEKSPPLQARVRVMQRLYIARKHGIEGKAEVLDPLFAELRRAIAERRLGPAAAALGVELLGVVDMEHGLWQGRPVDAATLDDRLAARDETTLQRFSDRLPTEALRQEARRRIVRLHIAASPFAEVREHAAEVETALMKQGNNPLSLAKNPPTRATVDRAKVPVRGVVVRQEMSFQKAVLLAWTGDRPGVSVVPELKLRGLLFVDVQGFSRPVTLCAPAKELDPSPCIVPGDVKVESPAAYVDKRGAFRFVQAISMAGAVKLTEVGDTFTLPLSIGGKPLYAFAWPLSYERPDDLLLSGDVQPGEDGLPLRVKVRHQEKPSRFIFEVAIQRRTLFAVVEGSDIERYAVGSVGARGEAGAAGTDGEDGSDGAECASGTDGTDGTDGGPGGHGGNGGDVDVQIVCSGDAQCESLTAVLRHVITSRGGAGGEGGRGGRGGRGGHGGAGRPAQTHTDENGMLVTDHPGCSGGMDGANGSDGTPGTNGAPGKPGHVTFEPAK